MCAIYALCAGAAAHRHYNSKKSKSRSGTVNDNKTVYISLEALAFSAVSTSSDSFIIKIKNNTGHHYNSFFVYCRELAPGTVSLTGDRAQGDDSKHDSHNDSNLTHVPF